MANRSSRRLFLLDYDGTLLPTNAVSTRPSEAVLDILRRLTADPANDVYIISGRGRNELGTWFQSVVRDRCRIIRWLGHKQRGLAQKCRCWAQTLSTPVQQSSPETAKQRQTPGRPA